MSGLIRPDWGEQLRLERGPDEEIVLDAPITADPSPDVEQPPSFPLCWKTLHKKTWRDSAHLRHC